MQFRFLIIASFIGLTSFFVVRSPLFQKALLGEKNRTIQKNENSVPTVTLTQTPQVAHVQKSIFIPYWNIPESKNELEKYTELIYFGVAFDESGSVIQDVGFTNLELFRKQTDSNKKRLLTVRLLDTDANLKLLEDVGSQTSVIDKTVEIAKENGFDGVILDFEVGALPLENTQKQISAFVKRYGIKVHESKLTFAMTMYGDVYYRGRPYDVHSLAEYVDDMYIMAYDFHKIRGEPGPNFPFDAGSIISPSVRASPLASQPSSQYPYDFKKMIRDFTKVVSSKKITVIFGMYGFDWTLGPQGKTLKAAKAIPLREIEEGIVPNCNEKTITNYPPHRRAGELRMDDKKRFAQISLDTIFAHVVTLKGPTTLIRKKVSSLAFEVRAAEMYSACVMYTNSVSKEKNITYEDSEGYKHELWYEDRESSNVKIEYLKKQGIGKVGYWVWGYF